MFQQARRKPRRLGREAGEEENEEDEDTGPVVRRPAFISGAKKSSKLRLSFGPGETAEDDLDSSRRGRHGASSTGSDLRKTATEKSSLKKSLNAPPSLENLAVRAGKDGDRPSYSKDYLSELRNSTPTTPQVLSTEPSDDDVSISDIVPASDANRQIASISDESGHVHIPTETEIREKKERRARLAKEQDYISLDDDGDRNQVSLLPKKKDPSTRNVRDDEDFAEGFDDFVEDGGIALGKIAAAAQRKKARADMQGLIENAEDSSDEDDSEAERHKAYEQAQTRAGMDGLQRHGQDDTSRGRVPTIITPIPRLGAVLERFRGMLREKEAKRVQLSKQMADLHKEKAEIGVREVEIQALITEAGDKYEKLRIEADLEA